MKKRHCAICVAKTKALISCAVLLRSCSAPLFSHMQKQVFVMKRLIRKWFDLFLFPSREHNNGIYCEFYSYQLW